LIASDFEPNSVMKSAVRTQIGGTSWHTARSYSRLPGSPLALHAEPPLQRSRGSTTTSPPPQPFEWDCAYVSHIGSDEFGQRCIADGCVLRDR